MKKDHIFKKKKKTNELSGQPPTYFCWTNFWITYATVKVLYHENSFPYKKYHSNQMARSKKNLQQMLENVVCTQQYTHYITVHTLHNSTQEQTMSIIKSYWTK